MARVALGELTLDGVPHPIALDLEAGQLDVQVGTDVALVRLKQRGSVLSIIHTEVPPVFRGRGVGEALARTVLLYARAQHLTVKPFCPFVAKFIRRHPEFQDLVDPTFSTDETAPD